jgi:hypothetical protein
MRLTSRAYITSGGKEYVPDGRPGAHSPFAFCLIKALQDWDQKRKVLTIAQLVAQIEGLEHSPRYGDFETSDPGGDFLFVPKSLTR